MYLQNLKISQFRNYTFFEINPSPEINCFFGNNGIGKTNLLEAIHYLSLTKGFHSEKDTVQYDQSFFQINGQFSNENNALSIQLNWQNSKGKKIFYNKQPLNRLSEHIGKIPLVCVLPSDVNLIHENSATRRRWIDSLISQYNQNYLQTLIRYEKVKNQRNALLKDFALTNSFNASLLEPYDFQLIQNGQLIAQIRTEFIQEFKQPFEDFFSLITQNTENPTITYQTQFQSNTHQEWQNLIQQSLSKDRHLQRTHIGIHRDDFQFFINQKPIQTFASQGQQKSFILALKLAQYQHLYNKTQLKPILLLDDFFDKLDQHRARHFAQIIQQQIQTQTFITDTNLERLQQLFNSSQSQFLNIKNNYLVPVADLYLVNRL